jgi:lactoylglutathione lyase
MKVKIVHVNYHVTDMQKSVAFYEKAVGLRVVKESYSGDGNLHFVMMTDTDHNTELELMTKKDHPHPYDLGDKAFHFAIVPEDYDAMHALHAELGCIEREMPGGNCYFILDPDGNRIEIMRS